ncbi:MAG: 3-oxoacyl-ACP reductase FabG [Holosporales bacterium]|jgi:3-oxoacyl-[acyl-carrier protein] reductase|nr:3-oxoacyl-ACP reductase FabG [Holosporales bacterium]
MLFSLNGLNALITGGAGAIGKKTAIEMMKQGANVVIADVRKDALEIASIEIKEKIGKTVTTISCDLLDSSETGELFLEAEKKIGQLDILVNNAGIDKDKLFMKMTEDDLDLVMNVNLKAAFTLTKSAVMVMSKRRFGRIVNISSVVGFTGNPGQVNYCASKAAIVGMSKAVALEYAKRGITVNCIAPGAIKTPMIDVLSEEAKEKFLSKIPIGYMADPVEIAYAICFLSSREASYITGQTLHVNGGMFIS